MSQTKPIKLPTLEEQSHRRRVLSQIRQLSESELEMLSSHISYEYAVMPIIKRKKYAK